MKVAQGILILSLLGTIVLGFGTPAVADSNAFNYPLREILERDLVEMARDIPQIERISVVRSFFDFISAVVIRIDYASGLSDSEKIDLQVFVENQLESTWYIRAVDPNMIVCIPENLDCPPPPGFVIGDLIVLFSSDTPTQPPSSPPSSQPSPPFWQEYSTFILVGTGAAVAASSSYGVYRKVLKKRKGGPDQGVRPSDQTWE